MKTNESESKVEESTMGTDEEKNIVKKILKNYVNLKTTERANLKQLSKRKFISQKALKQILALLLFDKRRTMTEVMEELALGPQTLIQWRKDFEEKRMDSLLVYQEKKKNETGVDKNEGSEEPKMDE